MTSIRPSDFEYCPYCSSRLTTITQDEVARKTCTYCKGWTHYPSVGLASVGIIVRSNKVLLVKRNRDPHKDTWGFPAGFVEYIEHPEDALKREIEQEVGLTVVKARFLKFVQSFEDQRSPGHLVFFYRVKTKGHLKNNDEAENQAIGWFPINNPPEIGWPTHKEMMLLLQKENRIKNKKGGKK